jgi:hypothetical protein
MRIRVEWCIVLLWLEGGVTFAFSRLVLSVEVRVDILCP